MSTSQRVAVAGVSHWHSTYDAAYLALLRELNVDIVGVSDPNSEIVRIARAGLDPSRSKTID